MQEKLTFAIVGTGSRGVLCFGELLKKRSDCTIKALCDRNAIRAKIAAGKLGSPAIYTDLELLLKEAKPDAVIITTPDASHEECAVKALKHKVNILIDKPLATTVKGCRNIIREAEKSGKVAMMGFNLRHAPLLMKLKEIVETGVLGRIFLVENREFYSNGRTYMARWNGRKSSSGGLWIHKGSHDFDVFNWLFGFPKPCKVAAFAGMNVFIPDGFPFPLEKDIRPGPCCSECHYAENGLCKDAYPHTEEEWSGEARKLDGYVKDSCIYLSDRSVHDNGFAIVEYENGVRACHMECFVTGMSDRFYTVVGTLGQASLSLAGCTLTVLKRWSNEKIVYEIPEPRGGHAGADPGLLESFIRAIRGTEPNTATFDQGMLSTAIGEAAELSRAENRVVFLKELLDPGEAPQKGDSAAIKRYFNATVGE
ncbi:MAG: putative oxidoreductase YteT precursor [Lentisphaerae bacterium ADurb.Bin242]|nr:MAG: putative oxidoreductase YteT precursor [Lentisphaerae bacterium ADurb.Bin242]